MNNTLVQWIATFYMYCLIGWIWESCYVSAKKRKWVNRGFLHGPMLPIYGYGAVLILFTTSPFLDSNWKIAVVGMIAASILEYFTGALMEQIFKVRYWDYSNQPLNLKGYICLSSSICWCVFSLLLVRIINPFFSSFIDWIPPVVMIVIVSVISVIFIYDTVVSIREAVDLREFLQQQMEGNDKLLKLQLRAEDLSGRMNELQQKAEESYLEKEAELLQIRQQIEEAKQALEERTASRLKGASSILKRNPGSDSKRLSTEIENLKQRINEKRK